MSFQSLIQSAQKHFPKLQIKYKDKSLLMKTIGKILFFNKSFMTGFSTTLGSTVYFPSENYIKLRSVSSSAVFLHELVHVKDAQKISGPIFGLLYLFPQILALFCLPLFLLSWKIALPLLVIFMLPIPAFFRMKFEKKAYEASLYALHHIGLKLSFDPKLERQASRFEAHFKSSKYYFMWPFSNIKKDFEAAIIVIRCGQRPYKDSIFDIIDELIKEI